MHRRALASTFALISVTCLAAPEEEIDFSRAVRIQHDPPNYFSVSTRFAARLTATFTNIGTVTSSNDIGDTTSEYNRTYDDGYVGIDSRKTDTGGDVFDDGRTNNWSYNYATQVTADQGGIAFHSYSSKSDGASAEADSGMSIGFDLEYARRFGGFGERTFLNQPKFTWGALAGVAMNAVNAKTSGTVSATLQTITDRYSLLGARPPEPGYKAPSSTTQTITNPDGTTSTVTIDTTTYLGNRPDSRTTTLEEGAAQIDGHWQVRGAFFSTRAGPWMRWQPTPRLSFRASAGGSLTWLGVLMRYDERLNIPGLNAKIISNQDETESETCIIAGAFATIEGEWWMSRRTAIFAGVMYDYFAEEADLHLGERAANVKLTSGAAIRIGITTRF